MNSRSEYVLGTRREEGDRLFRQHELWRPHTQQLWNDAGFSRDQRILDIGCGPGAAAVDLARLVGAEGFIAGVERDAAYVERARVELAAFAHAVHSMDLMVEPLPQSLHGHFDRTWSRWVAMFTPQPERVVQVAWDALVPGGVALFHEYVNYESYSLYPRDRGVGVSAFVAAVIRATTDAGGNVNTGALLPTLMAARGWEIVWTRPMAFCLQPTDPMWEWPASFVRTFAPQLASQGRLEASLAALAVREVDEAASGRVPGAFFVPPTSIVIAARKPG